MYCSMYQFQIVYMCSSGTIKVLIQGKCFHGLDHFDSQPFNFLITGLMQVASIHACMLIVGASLSEPHIN